MTQVTPHGAYPDLEILRSSDFRCPVRSKNLELPDLKISNYQISWKALSMDALPPYQRVYLFFRGVNLDSTGYEFNWAQHTTVVSL
jgi:hypothetical protein